MKNSRSIIVFCLCILLASGLACSSPEEDLLAPTLSSPNNGAVVNGTSITFQWNTAQGATKYFLRVSNSTYPNLDHETSFFSEDIGNVLQRTVSGFPDDGTEYVWGVWSGIEAGWCFKTYVLSNRQSFVNGKAQ